MYVTCTFTVWLAYGTVILACLCIGNHSRVSTLPKSASAARRTHARTHTTYPHTHISHTHNTHTPHPQTHTHSPHTQKEIPRKLKPSWHEALHTHEAVFSAVYCTLVCSFLTFTAVYPALLCSLLTSVYYHILHCRCLRFESVCVKSS